MDTMHLLAPKWALGSDHRICFALDQLFIIYLHIVNPVVLMLCLCCVCVVLMLCMLHLTIGISHCSPYDSLNSLSHILLSRLLHCTLRLSVSRSLTRFLSLPSLSYSLRSLSLSLRALSLSLSTLSLTSLRRSLTFSSMLTIDSCT